MEKRNAYRILVVKPGGKSYYEDLGLGVRIILKWMLERHDEVLWTRLIWLRIGTSGGLL
jgi:hypothetical protein